MINEEFEDDNSDEHDDDDDDHHHRDHGGHKKSKNLKKRQETSTNDKKKMRKRLPFDSFDKVIPHPMRDSFMTIQFKGRQRDYQFEFPRARDRDVFLAKLKGIFGPHVFAEHHITEKLSHKTDYHETKRTQSAMRSNISTVQSTGTLPWNFDR